MCGNTMIIDMKNGSSSRKNAKGKIWIEIITNTGWQIQPLNYFACGTPDELKKIEELCKAEGIMGEFDSNGVMDIGEDYTFCREDVDDFMIKLMPGHLKTRSIPH